MKRPITINQPTLLLGEGIDEVRVFTALLQHLGLMNGIQVLDYGGKSKLRDFLSTLKAETGFVGLKSVGITRDADLNAADALSSVGTAVAGASYPSTIRISHLILPGDAKPGALENLCCAALQNDPAWPCIEALHACRLERIGPWPGSVAVVGKAKMQTWLGTQNEPGLRLGEAAEKGLLRFDAPAFAPMIDFLRSL